MIELIDVSKPIHTYDSLIRSSELELVDLNDPILRQKLLPFDFSNPPVDPIELVRVMANFMKKHNGLGLSANQLGLPYRMFVMNCDPPIGCFNPKVVDKSTEMVLLDEGCLSYPNLIVKIRRAKLIRVRFSMANGGTDTLKFADLTARVYQHELNHLDGILFYQLASMTERLRAFNKKKKLDRKMNRRK